MYIPQSVMPVKVKVVIDYNSGMGGLDLSDNWQAVTTQGKYKKKIVKSAYVIWLIFTSQKRAGWNFKWNIKFNFKISDDRREIIRQSTRNCHNDRNECSLSLLHCCHSVSRIHVGAALKRVSVTKQGTIVKSALPFPVLPYGTWHVEVWKGMEDHGLVLKTTQ
jgi:hypothetical protein